MPIETDSQNFPHEEGWTGDYTSGCIAANTHQKTARYPLSPAHSLLTHWSVLKFTANPPNFPFSCTHIQEVQYEKVKQWKILTKKSTFYFISRIIHLLRLSKISNLFQRNTQNSITVFVLVECKIIRRLSYIFFQEKITTETVKMEVMRARRW
jgi:hypothetical protein